MGAGEPPPCAHTAGWALCPGPSDPTSYTCLQNVCLRGSGQMRLVIWTSEADSCLEMLSSWAWLWGCPGAVRTKASAQFLVLSFPLFWLRGFWHLTFLTRDWSPPSAVEILSPNHRTTREPPQDFYFFLSGWQRVSPCIQMYPFTHRHPSHPCCHVVLSRGSCPRSLLVGSPL